MPFPFTIIRCSLFQSTHPRGVRLFVIGSTTGQSQFQSTHPRGVRRGIANRILQRNSFNPRTHEGCDSSSSQQTCIIKVSIHAPTRGATERKMLLLIADKVSIHAPTRGATEREVKDSHFSSLFQSTHPRGVRLQM